MSIKNRNRNKETKRQYQLLQAWITLFERLPKFKKVVNNYNNRNMNYLDYLSGIIQVRQEIYSNWEGTQNKNSKPFICLDRMLDNLIKKDKLTHERNGSINELYTLCLKKI